jgi:hypothetical protein
MLSLLGISQEAPIIRSGLVSTQMTLSPSYLMHQKVGQFYAHGSLEAFLQPRVSFMGEGFYYLGTLGNTKEMAANHSLLFGLAWHLTKGNNDLFFALQPGVSFTRLANQISPTNTTHLGVNPIVAPTVGYTFYVSRFFHFFVQTKLVVGEHHYDVRTSLNEFRFSAGLGFNLNTLK